MLKKTYFCCLVLGGLLLSQGVYSQEENDEIKPFTVNELTSSRHLSGPEIVQEDLVGKVILFEYWGIDCPYCIESMPHLQNLQNKYEKTGKFMVIGSHSQPRDDKRIQQLIKKEKLTFPIYQGITISTGSPKVGVPYAVLMDHQGNVILQGSPKEMYNKVDKLVKKCPTKHFIFGYLNPKFQKNYLKSIQFEKNIELLLKEIEKKALVDSPAGKEAADLAKLINEYKAKEKATVDTLLTESPLHGLILMDSFIKMFPSEVSAWTEKVEEIKKLENMMDLLTSLKKINEYEKRIKQGKTLNSSEIKGLLKMETQLKEKNVEHTGLQNDIAQMVKRIGVMTK